MTFQLHALPAEDFAALHRLSDAELTQRNARRVIIRCQHCCDVADENVARRFTELTAEAIPACMSHQQADNRKQVRR